MLTRNTQTLRNVLKTTSTIKSSTTNTLLLKPYSLNEKFYSTSRNIDSTNLSIETTKTSRPRTPNKDLVFGKDMADHMLTIEWTKQNGWDNPKIQPYQPFTIEPSAIVFHYAVTCFEGMKAYISPKDGKIRLFRPDMNMKRLQRSVSRLTLPEFDQKELLECIKTLIKTDKSWIPNERGYSLYIRPTVMATQCSLGVGPSDKALLFVICSPVGPYYKTGFNAVSLYASTENVRAWPGGTGDAKVGSNYAPGILPQIKVAKEGYAQVLWLFGNDHYITEVGTMNFFCYWINELGEKELLTPPLDGTILPGVTRDSIIQLGKDWGMKVVEKPITMSQVIKASKENRLIELFGAGTAAIVSPIKKIRFQDQDINIPLDPKDPNAQAGPLTTKFADTIMGIQYGEIEHPWSVTVD